MAKTIMPKQNDSGPTKSSLKRKRAEEKARTTALFEDDFFAVDLLPDAGAKDRMAIDLLREQEEREAEERKLQEEADQNSSDSGDDREAGLSMNLTKVESDEETDIEELSFRQELEAQNEPKTARYYSSNEVDKTRQCTRCKEYGHLLLDCPHQVCSICGQLDDHSVRECPHKQCRRCGGKGHEASKCTNAPRRNNDGCVRCGARNHASTACPTIWRRYVKLPLDRRPPKRTMVYACYNCGSTAMSGGHFGTECPYPRGHPGAFVEGNPFTNGDGRPEKSMPWPPGYQNKITGNRPPPPTAPARRPHIVNGVRQQGYNSRQRERSLPPPQDYDDLLSNVRDRNRSRSQSGGGGRGKGRSGPNDRRDAKSGPKIQPLLARLGDQIDRDPHPPPMRDSYRPEPGSSRRPEPLPPRPPPRNDSYDSYGPTRSRDRPPPANYEPLDYDDRPDFDSKRPRDVPPPSQRPPRGGYERSRDPRLLDRIERPRAASPPSGPPRSQDFHQDFQYAAGADAPSANDDAWASQKNTAPSHQELIDSGEMRAPSNGLSYGRKPKNRTSMTMKSDYSGMGGSRIKGLATLDDKSAKSGQQSRSYDDWNNGSAKDQRNNNNNRRSNNNSRPNYGGSRRGGGGGNRPSRSYV